MYRVQDFVKQGEWRHGKRWKARLAADLGVSRKTITRIIRRGPDAPVERVYELAMQALAQIAVEEVE